MPRVAGPRSLFIHAQNLIVDRAGEKFFCVSLAIACLELDLDRIEGCRGLGIGHAQKARVAFIDPAADRAQDFRQSFEVDQLERALSFGLGFGIERMNLVRGVTHLDEIQMRRLGIAALHIKFIAEAFQIEEVDLLRFEHLTDHSERS